MSTKARQRVELLHGTMWHATRLWMSLPAFKGRDRLYLVARSHLKPPGGLVRFQSRDSLVWHLDLSEECDASLFVYGEFDPETLVCANALCDGESVAIDVGANIGCLALPLSRMVRSLHAFEPTTSTYLRLTQNLAENGCRNAVAVQAALGATTGTAALMPPTPHRSGDNRFVVREKLAGAIEAVPMETLDDYCDRNRLVPTFVKIDVEGSEWEVVRGASTVLKRHPRLILEANTDTASERGFHPLTMLAWLEKEYEYQFREIVQTGLRAPQWTKEERISCNVLGLHISEFHLFRYVDSLLSQRRRRSRIEVWPDRTRPQR